MRPSAAGALVFFVSATVLVLEIVAARLLAPYVGVTLETYTGIIGVVLAGIAVGNWLGGRLADRIDPRMILGPVVATGGAFAVASPVIVSTFGATLPGRGPLTIVVLATLGFFAPAVVLSAVGPTIVKLQLADLHETGEVVGRYAALGTAGAIVGTFAAGFLLIRALPSRTIVLGVGLVLVVVGMLLWWRLPERRPRRAAPVIAFALFAAAVSAAYPQVCDHESPYFCASVVEDPERPSGRTLVMDTLPHSYVDLDDATFIGLGYVRVLADVLDAAGPAGEPLDVVHIGGGGFTLPRYLDETRPGSRNVVLELDPSLVRFAAERFGFDPDERFDVLTGDARLTIRDLPETSFDVAVGDAFGGLAVPWHLTTHEFLQDVAATLRDGGVYAMNLIDHPPLDFLRAELATLREVFAHVAVLAPSERLSGDRGGNYILVASNAAIDVDALLDGAHAADDGIAALIGDDVDALIGDARPLTDGFAPVDQLLTPRRS
jgi:MFS family permease